MSSLALPEILLIALALSLDALAVSVAAACSGRTAAPRSGFRLAFHFGLFQALMPVLGWLAGWRLAAHIEAVDHWVAAGLLAVVAARMIRAGLGDGGDAPAGRPEPGTGAGRAVHRGERGRPRGGAEPGHAAAWRCGARASSSAW